MATLTSRIADLASAIAAEVKTKAAKTEAVLLTGAQSIAGKKTFTSEIVLANIPSDPSSLSGGMMWYNAAENAVKAYIGGQIVTLYRLTVGDPVSPDAGDLWYDLLTDKLMLRKGSTSIEVGASSGGANKVAVSLNFGATFTDKAQAIVTGQTWVTASSVIVAQVMTPPGVDSDEMSLLNFRTHISDLVDGVGFTVTLYAESFAKGSYTVNCMGA